MTTSANLPSYAHFASHPLEDSMTTHTCPRRVSAPAYYLGRPAALWLAALAPRSAPRTSPPASCASTSAVLSPISVLVLARAHRPGCRRTREGCVVELLVDVDQDGVVFDLAGVNRNGAAGKHADGLAGSQVVA